MEKIKNVTQNFINVILNVSEKILPSKLLEVEKKFLTVEVVLYLILGILTTIINIGLFAILATMFSINENISNAIAIVVAVLFAYFSNRGLVFNSTASTPKEYLIEFAKFMLGRGFTMILELVGFYLLFNIAAVPKLISKTLITIIVIILNFFISKFFAFKTNDD